TEYLRVGGVEPERGGQDHAASFVRIRAVGASAIAEERWLVERRDDAGCSGQREANGGRDFQNILRSIEGLVMVVVRWQWSIAWRARREPGRRQHGQLRARPAGRWRGASLRGSLTKARGKPDNEEHDESAKRRMDHGHRSCSARRW